MSVYAYRVNNNINQCIVFNCLYYLQEDAPGILSDTEFRAFWIRWNIQTGIVEAGDGEAVGFDRLINYQDTDMKDIHTISMTTDRGVVGYWDLGNLRDDGGGTSPPPTGTQPPPIVRGLS